MGLTDQETQLFASLWLDASERFVPELHDAQRVCNALVDALDDARGGKLAQCERCRASNNALCRLAPEMVRSSAVH